MKSAQLIKKSLLPACISQVRAAEAIMVQVRTGLIKVGINRTLYDLVKTLKSRHGIGKSNLGPMGAGLV